MATMFLDDWREEVKLRLSNSTIYKQFAERCQADPAGTQALSLVEEAVFYCHHRTKLVARHLKEYTLHDSDHLFRVLTLMARLIPPSSLAELSTPELMLLILSAFFHDIGMAPSEAEVQSWLRFWNTNKDPVDETTESFSLFVRARPNRLDEISRLHRAGRHTDAQILQEYIVADFIRSNHGTRVRAILEADWNRRIKYRDVDLTLTLAEVCQSHTEDALSSLLALDSALIAGPDTFACVPFVGVILRLADVLDFDAKRTPDVLFSHIGVRHPVSLQEWNKHRQVSSWIISPDRIAFSASCDHPATEVAIQRFCDIIDRELSACSTVLQNLSDFNRNPFPSFYRIPLPPRIDRSRIQPKKDLRGRPAYKYRDTHFTLNRVQVTDLLMGTSLYGDPSVALRELIQNSIDACLVRRGIEVSWGNHYEPRILVTLERQNNEDILIVEDNGIGMDQDIIDKYYSSVGASFYRSSDFYSLQAKHGLKFKPISQFGIGVLSCFMVADSFIVNTRRLLGPHESGQPLEIRIEGVDSIFWLTEGERKQPGTRTELVLRPNHPWKSLSAKDFIMQLRRAVPNPPIPIEVRAGEEVETHTGGTFRNIPLAEWPHSDHVRRIECSLDYPDLGMCGRAVVVLLEDDDEQPCQSKTVFSREVIIEDDIIELSTEFRMRLNGISRIFDSLEADEDNIEKHSSTSEEFSSVGEISLRGIFIPVNPFQPPWNAEARRQARLYLPFPIRFRVDVIDKHELTLNTARNIILPDERWDAFAIDLAQAICRGIQAAVDPDYWEELVKMWDSCDESDSKLGTFYRGLNALVTSR